MEVTDLVFRGAVASPPTLYQINKSILSLDLCASKLFVKVLKATKARHSLGFRTTLLGDFYSVL